MKTLKQLFCLFLLSLLGVLFGCEDEKCEQMNYYGPPPCESDEDCEEWNDGGSWYCDKEAEREIDSCGNMAKYAECKEKDAGAGR